MQGRERCLLEVSHFPIILRHPLSQKIDVMDVKGSHETNVQKNHVQTRVTNMYFPLSSHLFMSENTAQKATVDV